MRRCRTELWRMRQRNCTRQSSFQLRPTSSRPLALETRFQLIFCQLSSHWILRCLLFSPIACFIPSRSKESKFISNNASQGAKCRSDKVGWGGKKTSLRGQREGSDKEFVLIFFLVCDFDEKEEEEESWSKNMAKESRTLWPLWKLKQTRRKGDRVDGEGRKEGMVAHF